MQLAGKDMMSPPPPVAPTAHIELRDGVVFLRWSTGAVILERHALEAMQNINRLCNGREHPLLLESPEVQWVDLRAMSVFAGPWPLTRVAILGTSPLDHIFMSYYQARHTLPCPTRMFGSMHEALTWLKTPEET
ncbi:hypothetical protein AYX22_22485 (plasmid) [Arthrobacter sp. D5-1]|nr:hypothetical protein AYX22_22485 [Arthrobacter sp. D5-1]